MKITAETVSLNSRAWDFASLVLFEDEKTNRTTLKTLPPALAKKIEAARSLGDFTAKKDETLFIYPEGSIPSTRLFVIGAGTSDTFTLDRLRKTAATAMKKAKTCSAASVVFVVPKLEAGAFSPETIAQAVTEAALLSLYAFDAYKTKDKKPSTVKSLTLIVDDNKTAMQYRKGIAAGITIARAVAHTRDLANAPGGVIYPSTLADDARRTARACGIRATVLDRRKIEQLGMGGVINVGKGSIHDPRFIILEYKPRRFARTVALVGKGVTFDSGGISIKPSANMGEMRMDMHGGASVIGTLEAVAQLKLPVHLIGLIPAVENMPSGSAVKPGDIITQYNGMTTEVDNTDAEGRLILADALSYASGRYHPDVIIDLATLTGAVVVALGHHATGMLGTDEETMTALKSAGDTTYERVWQLPLFEEYDKQIKSDVADVKNVGGRWGGAITAAAFLKNFTGGSKWVHLDIAGTSYLEEAHEYIPKGASGVGVRLLVEYLRNLK
ncbi:MAG TPA: leucyl aminopeptidase [Bacteroidota bacterium]|nr:leucyl aminopeptidase [Bacteroidota bacterium]